MKVILIIVLGMHGLIHLMGFAKAFNLAVLGRQTQPISRIAGGFWLLASALFLIAMGYYLSGQESWWILAATAIVLSQVLIIMTWKDARFGTLGNIILLVPVLLAFLHARPDSYYHLYKSAVMERLSSSAEPDVLSDSALQYLPGPVVKYLRYTCAIGKPLIRNVRAVFSGRMKPSLESSWTDITSRQYDFFDNDRSRFFYIESKMYGLPFEGLHRYSGRSATMKIKLASFLEVADAKGDEMNQGETVTLLNDMCILAPATLISHDIRWETIDSLTVTAIFTNQGNTVSAVLHFNEQGALINFVSSDRFLSPDGKTYLRYPWSTPVREYRNFDGRKVPTYGEAIWLTPNGPFTYANFYLQEVEYNNQLFR